MPSKALVIPAAGAGKRMQHSCAKPFIKLSGKTILEHTLGRFLSLDRLQQIVIATSAEYMEQAQAILAKVVPAHISHQCVEGGAERQHSIYNALKTVEDCELVMVHDAVRPFVTHSHIERCCAAAEKNGAAVLGIPSKDTIKKVDGDQFVVETPPRENMWQVQTPQIFATDLLQKAYRRADDKGFIGTDDASLVEWMGEPVKMVKGSPRNIKLTYPRDLELARMILTKEDAE